MGRSEGMGWCVGEWIDSAARKEGWVVGGWKVGGWLVGGLVVLMHHQHFLWDRVDSDFFFGFFCKHNVRSPRVLAKSSPPLCLMVRVDPIFIRPINFYLKYS